MLRSIELTRYGAFTGRRVQLGPGLTVVVGPNESGKTTLRAALGDLLWELAPRLHPYAFVHAPNQLRLTAEVDDPDRPGCTRTVVVDSRGLWEGEDKIERWWTGGSVRTRAAWETALGLTLAGLREGTQAVVDGGGDLAPLVYRARTGIDLEAERARLSARADELFKRHANTRNVKVRAQAKVVEARRAAVAEATSAADHVVSLREARARASAAFETAVAELAAASVALESAERDQRCLPVVHELVELRDRLAALEQAGGLLDADELAAHDSAVRELAEVDDRIATLRAEVALLAERIEQADVDAGLADLEPAVGSLVKQERTAREARDAAAAAEHQVRVHRDELRRLLRLLDPASAGLADPDLEAAAGAALLPADVMGRLDREAERLVDAEERAEQARAVAADAVERSRSLVAGLDAASVERLGEARRRRDDAWREVREPWLRGTSLPDERRAELAAGLDAAHDRLDAATEQARDHAEATGRAGEADEQAAALLRAAAEIADDLARARGSWSELVRAAGLPEVLDLEAWDSRRDSLAALADTLEALALARQQGEQARGVVAAFEADVVALTGREPVAQSDPWVALTALGGQVAAAVKQRARQEAWQATLEERTDDLARFEARRARSAAVLDGFADDDLDDVLARSRDHLRQLEQEDALLARLATAAGPGVELEGIVAALAPRDAASVEQARLAAVAQAERCTRAHAEAHTADALAAQELARAERDGSAATLRSEEQEAAEQLAALVEEFLAARVQMALLDEVLAADAGPGTSALLAHAETLAQRLTEGRVRRLVVEEADGRRRLRVDADDLAQGSPAELSEGTADQVYLALRLAGIREQQQASRDAGVVPLPVVLDDVLQAHDDARTAAALAVLVEESHDQQIVLFSHHEAVAALAADAGATVVRLDPLRAQTTVAEPVAPRRRRAVRAVPAAASAVAEAPEAPEVTASEDDLVARVVVEQQVIDAYLGSHDALPGEAPAAGDDTRAAADS